MSHFAHALTLLGLGLAQLTPWQLGLPGFLGPTLIGIGIRCRHHGCVCAGALLLVALLIPPGR